MMTGSMMNTVTPEKDEQQCLFGPLPTGQQEVASTGGDGMPPSPASTTGRLFFPTNREDILLQLSSLVISRDFPPGLTVVPVQDDALAFLPDGLRTSEISLLHGEQVGRFPVLVELREATRGERVVFGISEVAALCFRSQADVDDFRFRPVDEVNTEEVTCRVDPQIFDLPGAARFRHGPQESPELQDRGRFSDRIAGGVGSLFELGTTWPVCWRDIADLLCRAPAAASDQEITLARALSLGRASSLDGAQAHSVLQAFVAHAAGESASSIVERVHANLVSGTEDAGQLRRAERWFAMANAVLQNRARLDGELLSDEGSVPLRAALLAAVVDDVHALVPFVHAPRPAGQRVIVAAAFLIGLRTGVTDMPWTMKRSRLNILSSLIVALQGAASEEREIVGLKFQVEPDETPAGVVLRLLWNDQDIAGWQPFEAAGPSAQEQAPDNVSSATDPQSVLPPDAGSRAKGMISADSVAAESGATNCIPGPDGRLIELLNLEPPRKRGVTMRCNLSETDRLRKPKEILESACTEGLLWRVGVNPEGAAALYADLPDWPDESMLNELGETLQHALDLYLVKKKKSRSTAASTRRLKGDAGRSEAATVQSTTASELEANDG